MKSKQVQKVTVLAEILGEAIQGLGEVPNGHLYARVMGKIGIDDYNGAIKSLKDAGLVTETSHLLRWVGHAKK
jgi:hypothetical protein